MLSRKKREQMKPSKIDLTEEQINELSIRIESNTLTQEDKKLILDLINAVSWLGDAIQEKNISIKRLLKQIFGFKTESSKNIKSDEDNKKTPDNQTNNKEANDVKGHGRNGIEAYKNAEREYVHHESLKVGDKCPECPKGTIYKLKKSGSFINIIGTPPLKAKIYELEKFRCGACQTIFTAKLPEDANKDKYDDGARTIITLLKYGYGFPFNRQEKFQESLGVPMPASTQWEIVEEVGNNIFPIYGALKKCAANGDVIHNDDTGAKILTICREEDVGKKERTGIFTTGIVSKYKEYEINLYFTGKKHAGENLEDLLSLRDKDLSAPIQMCDALSRNIPKALKTIVCNCLSHARRNVTDIYEFFPYECKHIIDELKKVYINDDHSKKEKMNGKQRLKYHVDNSKKVMDDLHDWLKNQIEEKKVEPNSSLGKAINYFLSHWIKLTKFLSVAKAPLDNNICERALKKAILNRKNSYFFKTEFGALIGSMHMSIIETCIRNSANPYNYYVEVQKNRKDVSKNPEKWLPWNYLDNL